MKLTVALPDREAAERAGRGDGRTAAAARRGHGDDRVVGPAPAYIARRNDRWRYHVILRGDDPLAVLGGDPGPPWSVDVDPDSLL